MEYTDCLDREREALGVMEQNHSDLTDELPKAERRYKDSVFRMLFRKKKALLSLYNAVNKTNFTNEDEMEIVTLENAIYMGMKNDVSCVFDFELSLYEHQSTVNPNMPLRDLFYVAKQLQKIVEKEKKDLYSSKPIQIPAPRFVVFYNGSANRPEREECCLSDLFAKQMERPELELIVTVYNINPGMNEELLEACQLLKEYMLFTTKVRENQVTMELNVAVHKAVEACIQEGILEDFLREQRAEVIEMCIYEYDQEKHMQLIKEENWEDGHAAGLSEGLSEGREQGKEETRLEGMRSLMDKMGLSAEQALCALSVPPEEHDKYLAKL